MLYRKTITEEHTYESEAERAAHVASMVEEGFVDSGQVKERIHPAVMISGGSYPIWDNNPDDFTWYSRLTKTEEPGMKESPSESKTAHFGLSAKERKLRRLHEFALVGVGDSKEGRAMVNDCYLTLLALVPGNATSE